MPTDECYDIFRKKADFNPSKRSVRNIYVLKVHQKLTFAYSVFGYVSKIYIITLSEYSWEIVNNTDLWVIADKK